MLKDVFFTINGSNDPNSCVNFIHIQCIESKADQLTELINNKFPNIINLTFVREFYDNNIKFLVYKSNITKNYSILDIVNHLIKELDLEGISYTTNLRK